MRTLRLAAASLLIVVLAVGAWAGVYTYEKGFSQKWRRMIMEEFDRRGIEAEIGKLTIDPIEGLVARDVKIFADKRHHSVVASMDNITLDIDFAKLLRKQQFLNTVEFRDADISFPVDPEDPDGERLEIKNFSARVRLPENKIEIDRAECDFHGVHISLVGSLLQPKPKSDRDDSAELERQLTLMKQRRTAVAAVVTEIENFHFGGTAPPHLHLEVIGDLETPESIEATARLTSSSVGRGNYYCDRLEVRAEYRYPDILIDQIKIIDRFGELYADAHWRIGSDTVPFHVESSIDAHTLVRSLFETNALGEVVFYSAPKLGASGEIYLGEKAADMTLPLKLMGTFECGGFSSSGGQIFEGAYAEFSIDPTRWYVRNLSLDHKTGSAGVNALYDSATGIVYDGEIDMDPTVFIPFFRTEQTQHFLRRFEFDRENPIISLSVSGGGPSLDQRGWTTKGKFMLGHCLYRDVPLVAATGTFEVKGKDMIFRDFRINRHEGHIDGDLVHVRGAEQMVEVHNVRGSVYPAITAAYFAPATAKALDEYKFLQPPYITLNGLIDSSDQLRSDFTASFQSSGPASFRLFKRELPVTTPDGTVAMRGDQIDLTLKAGLLGGSADYRGTFGIGPRAGNTTGDLTAEGIDFAQLAELYEIPTETHGTLDGNLRFAVPAADRKRWSGKGRATLTEGDVFAIPVMGRMSRLISNVLERPEAGYSVANEASASIDIDGGVLRTDDFVAYTPGFVLRAKGTIDPIDDRLDIDAEMNARGPLRLVGWPLSKLLRYKGEGALSDPQWRPVNFTLARRGAGLLPPGESPDRPRLTDVVTAVPKATVGVGSKALGTGAKALGAGAKALGTGTKSAVEMGNRARDFIPIPRVFPKKDKPLDRDKDEPSAPEKPVEPPDAKPPAR